MTQRAVGLQALAVELGGVGEHVRLGGVDGNGRNQSLAIRRRSARELQVDVPGFHPLRFDRGSIRRLLRRKSLGASAYRRCGVSRG